MSSSFELGIAACLGSPFLGTLGFLFWDDHWKGSAFALNAYKCSVASFGFVVVVVISRFGFGIGDSLGLEESVVVISMLVLSSILGIIVGDLAWLEAMQRLGARRVIVIDSVKPFLAAFLGWLFFGENLRPVAFGGLALTSIGITLVSMLEEEEESTTADHEIETKIESTADEEIETKIERTAADQIPPQKGDSNNTTRIGFVMALFNVIFDTIGNVITKAYGRNLTTWEINLVRFGFAAIVLLCVSIVCRLRNAEAKWCRLPVLPQQSMLLITLGVGFVTFLGPALYTYGLFQVALALAITLNSVGPLYALPLSLVMKNDRPAPKIKEWLGAVFAVTGIVVLTIWGRTTE